MMMRISVCKLLFFAAVLLLGLSGGATPATAKTLAITPFTVNAAEDLTYLSRGAADMLASRIAAQTDVSVLDMALVGAEAVKMPAPLTRASAADLAALKRTIQENQVKVIFTELGTSPAVAKAIGDETGARVVELTTHTLPGDGSYFTFMRNMADVITGALK